jgi:hypothetical protein
MLRDLTGCLMKRKANRKIVPCVIPALLLVMIGSIWFHSKHNNMSKVSMVVYRHLSSTEEGAKHSDTTKTTGQQDTSHQQRAQWRDANTRPTSATPNLQAQQDS